MTETFSFEPGDELCPSYWPQTLWDLLHPHGGPVGPVAEFDDILAGLAITALSHRLVDQDRGAFIRSTAADTVTKSASQLPGVLEFQR